jgi:Carbohydrate esterase, sialic acid-specific acetylesterase
MDPLRMGRRQWTRRLRSFLILSHSVLVTFAAPIKVFLLAGQSNMVGHGSIDHLDFLIQQSEDPNDEYRKRLWNGTQYITRKDVYVKFGARHGFLTVSRTAGLAAPNSFGPELLFGIAVGDALSAPTNEDAPAILLLKTAYGGRSLAVDFRPPSAGRGNYTEVTDPSWYGWQYREMMTEIQYSLANLPTYMPGYNATLGYELCGLVWFQGWNDVLDWPKVYEYESNLQYFIRDVRRDLQAPNLPFGTTVLLSI